MDDQSPRFSWGHININVMNLERSIQFYEKLGFELFIPAIPYLGLTSAAASREISRPGAAALGLDAKTRARACIMQLDRGFPKIDLTEIEGGNQAKPLTNSDLGLVRFCLASQNLAEDYETLCSQGIEFLAPPQTCDGGLADIATCVDPDGTLVELLQVYLDKWPRLDLNK